MRTLALVLLSVLLAVPTFAEDAAFSPKGSGYSVKFPGKPKETESTSAATEVVTHLASMSKDGGMYVVTYADYSDEHAKVPEKMYDNGRDTVARNMLVLGKLVSDKKIELNGVTGREVVSERKMGTGVMTVKYRMYMVKNRMYQIMYMSSGDMNSKDALAYLDSFKLTGK